MSLLNEQVTVTATTTQRRMRSYRAANDDQPRTADSDHDPSINTMHRGRVHPRRRISDRVETATGPNYQATVQEQLETADSDHEPNIADVPVAKILQKRSEELIRRLSDVAGRVRCWTVHTGPAVSSRDTFDYIEMEEEDTSKHCDRR
jgi:hypothetical protein